MYVNTFTYKDEDASKFLQEVIELGGLHEVEDTPNKTIIDATTHEPVVINTNSGTKTLVLFGSQDGTAAVVNPFSDNSQKLEDSWFYNSRVTFISGIVYQLIRTLLEAGVKANSGNSNLENKVISNLISDRLEKLDDSTLEEYDRLAPEMSKIIVIFYNSSRQITEVSSLFHKSLKSTGLNIRMKTWNTIMHIFNDLLGIESLSELEVKSNTISCPILDGFVQAYLDIFSRLKSYLYLIDGTGHFKTIGSQIKEIRKHLKNLDAYKQVASWVRTPMNNTAVVQPQAQPVVQSNSIPVMPVAQPPVPMQQVVPVQPVMPVQYTQPVMPVQYAQPSVPVMPATYPQQVNQPAPVMPVTQPSSPPTMVTSQQVQQPYMYQQSVQYPQWTNGYFYK